MKKIIYILMCLIVGFKIFAAENKQQQASLILIGNIPGRYFSGVDAHSYVLGYLEIKNRVITQLQSLKPEEVASVQTKNPSAKVLILKQNGTSDYDVIYPGLINLHNHTKQNNLPIWSEAQGQFANRFEWRDWPNYKFTVSGNMNPWVDFARAIECATYRWSELHAMTLGTVYLQGPSSCVDQFAIQRVEDADSFISNKAPVQAPTDLVMPNEMQFVWNTLGPIIKTGKTYEQALAQVIKQYCPKIAVTADNVNGPEMLKIFKDQATFVGLCQKDGLPDKFIRYVYWIHPTIAGRKNYFNNPKAPYSAVIAHLAEGRRDDTYNQKEFEVVKMLGLDLPQMNFVHGVGIPKSEYPDLAKKNMGLIWSPFSNLILYSQTLDVGSALKAGVRVAIGSDWVPTGTKSVLEEVKLARRYILKDIDHENLVQIFSDNTGKIEKIDEQLFKMLTENPAAMIGHSEIIPDPTKKSASGYIESAVGRIAVGAMGSVIVVSKQHDNPYTNIIEKANEKNINLVVVDGKTVYGNKSYFDTLGYSGSYEVLPVDSDEYTKLSDAKVSAPKEKTPESLLKHVVETLSGFAGQVFTPTDKCQFTEAKVFMSEKSVDLDEDLKNFKAQTSIDLDRVQDITKLLAIHIMTQNRNKIDPAEGKPNFAMKYYPALYSCNDENHQKRLESFIKTDGSEDVLDQNRKYRKDIIEKQKLGRGPAQLADKYK